MSLLRLAGCRDVATAVDHARSYPYLEFAPHPVAVDGGTVTIYNGDVAYDAEPGAGIELPGVRHRLYMVGTGLALREPAHRSLMCSGGSG